MKEKGITLVALVVTIVVTIILAGITIGYIMGDSSVIKVAQNSVEETDNAIKQEQDDLQNLVNLLHGEQDPIPEDILADPTRDGNGDLSGDGIPDYLQYKVSYNISSGQSNFRETVVTKILNGIPSENGVAMLEEAHIPSIAPSAGYEIGKWEPSDPKVGAIVSGNITYSMTCSNKPIVVLPLP